MGDVCERRISFKTMKEATDTEATVRNDSNVISTQIEFYGDSNGNAEYTLIIIYRC